MRWTLELLEEIDVEWETPEVTAYYQENEVEVTYQFGIIPGDKGWCIKTDQPYLDR